MGADEAASDTVSTVEQAPPRAAARRAAELLAHSSLVDRVVRWTREDLAQGGLRELCRRLREAPVDRLYLVPQDRTTPRAELRLLVALRLGGLRDVRGANVTTAHFLPAPLARAHDRELGWRPIASRLLEQVECAIAGGRTDRTNGDSSREQRPRPRLEAESRVTHTTHLEIDAPRRERALLHLARLAPGGEPLLCLAPGAKLEHKRWPAERFGAVALYTPALGRRRSSSPLRLCASLCLSLCLSLSVSLCLSLSVSLSLSLSLSL